MQERRRAASSQMLMVYWTGHLCRALSQSSSAGSVSMGRGRGADAESHCEELITLESLSLCHSSSEKAAQRNEKLAKQVSQGGTLVSTPPA